nr:hypothetical protein HmN_000009700 [Hymenolepis microstoma]
MDASNDCSICLNLLAPPSGSLMDCPHKFCYVCIKKWASFGNRTCPMCRAFFGQIGISLTVGGEVTVKEPLFSNPTSVPDVEFDSSHLTAYEQIGVNLATGGPIADYVAIRTSDMALVDFTKNSLKYFLLRILDIKGYASQFKEEGLSRMDAEYLRSNLSELRERYVKDVTPLFLIPLLWTNFDLLNCKSNEPQYVQKVLEYLNDLQKSTVAAGNNLLEILKAKLSHEDYEELKQFYNGINE